MPLIRVPYDPALGPIIEIEIGFPVSELPPGQPGTSQRVTLMVDTGARTTYVSKAVADALNLPVRGQRRIISSTNQTLVESYQADLWFPGTQILFCDLLVFEFMQPTNHYVGVLGRDITNTGVVHLDGRTKELALIF
jgi:hypothetical protein